MHFVLHKSSGCKYFGRTKCVFLHIFIALQISFIYCFVFLKLVVQIPWDSRGFTCRSKWKWPVTFPVALAGTQTATQLTASTMSHSFVLISSPVMPNVGMCSLQDLGLPPLVFLFCSVLLLFISFIIFIISIGFSLCSKGLACVCGTKQSFKVFSICSGTAEGVGQSVCVLCCRLHVPLHGLMGITGKMQQKQATLLRILLWCCSCFLCSPDKGIPYLFKQPLNPRHISKRALPLIPWFYCN